MGLSINLQHASWLAHMLKPSGSVPPLKSEHGWEQSEVLHQFLHRLKTAGLKFSTCPSSRNESDEFSPPDSLMKAPRSNIFGWRGQFTPDPKLIEFDGIRNQRKP